MEQAPRFFANDLLVTIAPEEIEKLHRSPISRHFGRNSGSEPDGRDDPPALCRRVQRALGGRPYATCQTATVASDASERSSYKNRNGSHTARNCGDSFSCSDNSPRHEMVIKVAGRTAVRREERLRKTTRRGEDCGAVCTTRAAPGLHLLEVPFPFVFGSRFP